MTLMHAYPNPNRNLTVTLTYHNPESNLILNIIYENPKLDNYNRAEIWLVRSNKVDRTNQISDKVDASAAVKYNLRIVVKCSKLLHAGLSNYYIHDQILHAGLSNYYIHDQIGESGVRWPP
jgi:hypothetical protein